MMPPLYTPRLRLEFVTATLMRAATHGRAALEAVLDARIGEGWAGEYVFHPSRRIAVEDRPVHALVVLRMERLVVGELRFEPVGDGAFEIGYAVAGPYRRQGIAVEAGSRLLRWLHEDVAASRIVAGCAMNNTASVRTLRRLGFALDGSSRPRQAFWWTWEASLSA